jgi:DHA2 family multidrug resistance protein
MLMNKPVNPWLIAIIVSMATFMEVLDTTITNVSLSHIAGSLGSSQIEATWVITSYLVANAITLPLSGWLANSIGRKKYFMLSIASFTFFSFLCGMAQSLSALIFFRVLQGIGGGGLQSTQQAIILDAFPPNKRGVVFGITGITLICAPIIGPTLGGWITDTFTWRWIFLINIPVGLLALFFIYMTLIDPPHAKAQGFKNVDFVGLIFIILGIGSLQILLDQGQHEDWFNSLFIIYLGLASLCFLSSGVIWLLYQKDPIVKIQLFKDKCFALSCFLIFIVGFLLYSSTALFPLMLQSLFGYTATLSGLVLTPGGLATIFLMPVAGKLIQYVNAKVLAAIGLCCMTTGLYYSHWLTPTLSYQYFVLLRILQIIGLPLLFIPVSTLAYRFISKEDNNKASGIFSLARNLGGSVGIALSVTYFQRQQQMEFNNLINKLNSFDLVYTTAYQNTKNILLYMGSGAVESAQQVYGVIYQQLLIQSSLLAYQHTFLFLSLLSFLAIFLTFLAPNNLDDNETTVTSTNGH